MARSAFDVSVNIVLEHEAGYSDHPRDRGGPTNMGITQRTLNAAKKRGAVRQDTTIKGISRGEAIAIYRALFWDEVRGDALPQQIALVVFDAAVLSGPETAIKMLQTELRVSADGVIGNITLLAARRAGVDLIDRFLAARAAFYMDIIARDPTQMDFRDGWFTRCFAVARQSAGLGVVA